MKVKLSRLASYKLELILDYIDSNWSEASREKFLKRLNKKLTLIKKSPLVFPQSKIRPDIRKLVISKQNSAYYLVKTDEILVITIFDSRQDQKRLFKEIKKHFA